MNQLCLYCLQRPATTIDHCFQQALFNGLRSPRHYIKTPCCSECNNKSKSQLDQYLSFVFRTGSNICHPSDLRGVRCLPKDKKQALHEAAYHYFPNGLMSVKIDPEAINAAAQYWVPGLMFEYFGSRKFFSHIKTACFGLSEGIEEVHKLICHSGKPEIFHDNNRFNGLIKYIGGYSNGIGFICLKILNPFFRTKNGELSQIIGISFKGIIESTR